MRLTEIIAGLQVLYPPNSLKRTIGHLVSAALDTGRNRTEHAWPLTEKERLWLAKQGFVMSPMIDNSTDFVTDVREARKGEVPNCWVIGWPSATKCKGIDPKKLKVGARYWYARDGEEFAVQVLRDQDNDGKYLHPVKAGITPGSPLLGRWDYRYDFEHLVRKLMKPKR